VRLFHLAYCTVICYAKPFRHYRVSIGTKCLPYWIDLLPMAVIAYTVDIHVNHFLGFNGLLALFALVAEIKNICGFNHTVNNMVHADQTLHVVYIRICMYAYMVSITHPLVAAAVACTFMHCERVPCVSNAG